MNVQILHEQPVSKNFFQQSQEVTSAFPQAATMTSGDIAVLYRQGTTKHSHDGVLLLQTSSDRGSSWSEPRTVFDGRGLNPPQTVVSGGICEAEAGTLFVTFFTLEGLEPGVYMFSDDARPLRRHVYASSSRDGGVSWSDPVTIGPFPYPSAGITCKPLALPGGELFVPLEIKTEAGVNSTAAIFSQDGGQIFGAPVICADDPEGQLNLCDGRFALLRDDRLLMMLWTFRQEDEETIEVRRSFSDDGGRTWSVPHPTGFVGQVTAPLALPSGEVIAVSNFRDPPEGIRLWASHDDGETWRDEPAIQMWDPRSKEIVAEPVAAEASERSDEGVWEALGKFTFGTPDVVNLRDGSQLMVYYATIGDVIGVRACRFQVTL